jgi:hypothetical protein
MRHRRERLETTGIRAGELRWMAAGTLMLLVLLMMIFRLREPGSLDWLSQLDRKPAPQTTAPTAAARLPSDTGPTDEDSDQAETAREEFGAITDGTLSINKEETSLYNRLIFWVKNQPFARLWGRATKNLAYTYLYDSPDEHRGQLIALDVNLVLVTDAGKNDDGVALREAWATTDQSGDRLYVLLVVDLPKKIPVGRQNHERAKFAGYFMKLQGYHPAMSKPGQTPEKAPLLIGRIEWTPAEPPATTDSGEWKWGLAVAAVFAIVCVVHFVRGRRRKNQRQDTSRSLLNAAPDGVIPVEAWLESAGFASPDSKTPDGGAPDTPHPPTEP